MENSETNKVIILALDELGFDESLRLAEAVGQRVYALKIHNLFDEFGAEAVQQLRSAGAKRVWVDAKLYDIPKTVKLRAAAIAKSGADIVTVHASGGIDMMMAALEAGISEVYAISVLTSLTEEDTHLLHGQPSKAEVLRLARDAKLAGVHGVVCSPKEVGLLSKRKELTGLKFVIPGVRSPGVSTDDQQRVDTPEAAIKAGAKHLVIGRQVTKAQDPLEALKQIEGEVMAALFAGIKG